MGKSALRTWPQVGIVALNHLCDTILKPDNPYSSRTGHVAFHEQYHRQTGLVQQGILRDEKSLIIFHYFPGQRRRDHSKVERRSLWKL